MCRVGSSPTVARALYVAAVRFCRRLSFLKTSFICVPSLIVVSCHAGRNPNVADVRMAFSF